jgi:hypothetical protein
MYRSLWASPENVNVTPKQWFPSERFTKLELESET